MIIEGDDMTAYNYEITKYSVAVELDMGEFVLLDNQGPEHFLDVVMPRLSKLGAMDIEYNGHFGAAIFFDVEKQEEIPLVIEAIKAIIADLGES